MLAQQQFNQHEWNRQQYNAALLTMISLIAWGIPLASSTYLPMGYASMVMSVGPAMYMTGFWYLSPNLLRSRSGSLFAAICMIACLWLNALVVTAAVLWNIIFR